MATGAKRDDIIQGQSSYRLEEIIATGGLAEVWKATVLSGPAKDVKKLDVAALKFPIEPEHATYLREEAKTLDHLWEELPKVMPASSVALVEVIEHGASANNGYFIAMRYYDRTSLNRFYPEPQPVPSDVMANVMQAIAPTLDAAHHLNPPIMHRDIKLGNVLLDSSGRIVLADFLPEGYGNVRYAAPEVVFAEVKNEGWQEIDSRADIYSLGVMLYRALTGHYPVEIDLAEPEQELKQAYDLLIEKNVPVPVPGDIPAPLYSVLERALQRGRRYRYSSCLEMATDFVTKRHAAPVSTPEERPVATSTEGALSIGQSSRRAVPSFRWIAIVGAVCLVALAVLLITAPPPREEPSRPSPAIIATATRRIIIVVDPTDTPAPTNTPTPTNTPAPTNTPVPPTNTPVPPTNTPVPVLPAGCLDDRKITYPAPNARIRRGPIEIRGAAYPAQFARYKLEWAAGVGADDQSYTVIREISSRAQAGTTLAIWETGALPAGRYSLRLKVVKPDGNWYDPPCVIVVELQ